MYRRLHIFFLILVLAGCVAVPRAPRSEVAGRVSSGAGQPQSGVVVAAYPLETASLGERAPYQSAPTGEDGAFRLALPPGDYFLLARGAGFFCYYGRNPVSVAVDGLAGLNLGLVREAPLPAAGGEELSGGIAGQLLHDGQPLAGAMIQIYTDLSSRLKGMGYAMAGPTGADGRFAVELPAGTYYLLARLRQGGGGMAGPLKAGDFIGYSPENPLRVEDGQVRRVSVPMLVVPDKVDRLAATLFGQTAVQGRILRRDGSPAAGLRAVLYEDPQMLNRPLYVSQPTGADGSYTLSFPHGGTYFLAARSVLGGAPAPGELFGTYDGSSDHAVQISEGERKAGIDIIVEEMW